MPSRTRYFGAFVTKRYIGAYPHIPYIFLETTIIGYDQCDLFRGFAPRGSRKSHISYT